IPDGDVGTIVERALGAARSPTSLVAGVPRRAPSNSITWTVLRERTSTGQRTYGCCAEPITSTPPNRCTVARSWSEPADRPRPLQLFPGLIIHHSSPRERRVAPRAAGAFRIRGRVALGLRCFSAEVLGRNEAPAHVRSPQNGRSSARSPWSTGARGDI